MKNPDGGNINLYEKLLGKDIAGLPSGSKLWRSKEWTEKRKIKLKDKCEKCGSTNQLTIHHKYKIIDPVMRFYAVLQTMIMKEKPNFAKDKVCPECGRRTFYSRQFKLPKYKCPDCYNEFDTPKIDVVRDYTSLLKNPDNLKQFYEWLGIHHKDILNRVRTDHLEAYTRYKELLDEDIVTLCSKCHYIATKRQEHSFQPDNNFKQMCKDAVE